MLSYDIQHIKRNLPLRALHLGFENLLVQPLAPSDDFLPDFDQDKPFKGNPG